MSLADIDPIAEALLYEGYLLYPYRASSVKNRQRFNFGVLYPDNRALLQGGNDRSTLQTECLVRGDRATTVDAHLRFLQLQERRDDSETASPPWREAVRRDVAVGTLSLGTLIDAPVAHAFAFDADETITDANGRRITRVREQICGLIDMRATALGNDIHLLRCTVANTSDPEGVADREAALMRSLASAHTAFVVGSGAFVSLLEPPPDAAEAAATAENIGTWPVLVGAAGSTDTLLSSPIILYDYPAIAPESPGDLFDGAEIDEILSLRIMTLTDDERREMAATDDRARRILERTDRIGQEDFMRMHGMMKPGNPEGDA